MSAVNLAEWNPRYLAYAAFHGHSDPEAMLAADAVKWPGGCMTGFVLWVQARWWQWASATGRADLEALTPAEHDHFTGWLADLAARELGRLLEERAVVA